MSLVLQSSISVSAQDAGAGAGATRAASGGASPASIKMPFKIVPLTGSLDKTPLFNSNSPEIILSPGILLSTLNPINSKNPDLMMDYTDAHLNYTFKKDFGVFMHHIAKQDLPADVDKRTLKLGFVAYNPGTKPVTLINKAHATYLTQPESPFVVLPPVVSVMDAVMINGSEIPLPLPATPGGASPEVPPTKPNNLGPVSPYAGPGDRVTWEFLSEKAWEEKLPEVTVAPKQFALIEDIKIPTLKNRPALNGRSYLGYFHSTGPLQLALIARFDNPDSPPPQLDDLLKSLKSSDISRPRESDKNFPSPPGRKGPLIYGRVSGISRGLVFNGRVSANLRKKQALALAVPISSLERGTFGTGQIQAAPMYRRYRDCAYRSQGNYGIAYKVMLHLANTDSVERKVNISIACPVKEDRKKQDSLTFLDPPAKNVFYRGTVMLRDRPIGAREFYHLVMHKGERMPVLKVVSLEPYQTKQVELELYYPPDATPPQMLLLESPTLESSTLGAPTP